MDQLKETTEEPTLTTSALSLSREKAKPPLTTTRTSSVPFQREERHKSKSTLPKRNLTLIIHQKMDMNKFKL